MVLARLLRRTEGKLLSVPQPGPLIAAPNSCPHPTSVPAVPNQSSKPMAETVAPKRRRKQVHVEGLYLEREPEPKRHARALLELIQDECPEKVGSFIPRSHLDRAYRELCDHEGWKALSFGRPNYESRRCRRVGVGRWRPAWRNSVDRRKKAANNDGLPSARSGRATY